VSRGTGLPDSGFRAGEVAPSISVISMISVIFLCWTRILQFSIFYYLLKIKNCKGVMRNAKIRIQQRKITEIIEITEMSPTHPLPKIRKTRPRFEATPPKKSLRPTNSDLRAAITDQ
jgi:hypothetical protein